MPVNLTYSTILRMANGDLNGNLLFFWGGEINSLTIFILLLLLLCRFKVHVRLDGTLGSPICEQHRTRPCAVLAILWLDNGTIATISGHFLATRGIQIESGAKRLPQRGLVHSGRVLPQGYRELKNRLGKVIPFTNLIGIIHSSSSYWTAQSRCADGRIRWSRPRSVRSWTRSAIMTLWTLWSSMKCHRRWSVVSTGKWFERHRPTDRNWSWPWPIWNAGDRRISRRDWKWVSKFCIMWVGGSERNLNKL